jgi:hypothetical protein
MSFTGDDADARVDDANARVAMYELLRLAGCIQDNLHDVGTAIDRFREGRTTVPSATHTPGHSNAWTAWSKAV